VYSQKIEIKIPKDSQPYNFDYLLEHYVLAPWVREKNKLARLFRLSSGKPVLLRISFRKKISSLIIELRTNRKITKSEEKWLVEMVSWNFGVKDKVKHFYKEICEKDPILKAASREIYGAHLRTDPYVFESVVGVIVAQNVQFKRIYQMLKLLCQNFGDSAVFNGKKYYSFPTPQRIAKAPLEKIRACKVGYRDKYIKGVAEKLVQEKIDLEKLRDIKETGIIREKLMELPGVGPYTADLVLAIGFRRPTFHLDLFTREALYTFYFGGKKVSDKKLITFVNKRWGNWKHHAMLLLTTNTDSWARELGINFRLKSGAKLP
jgi:DNA-3-methyladenine glycosylase II